MFRVILGGLLVMLGASAGAQNGLHLAPDGAAGMRASERNLRFGVGDIRFDLSVAQPGTAQARARLLGDYYLSGPVFGGEGASGGLRLTSGLAVGPRDGTAALPPTRLGGGLSWNLPEGGGLADRHGARVALPYIGLGYTGLAAGWGLSADIGLGGLRPGERVRFGAGNPTAAQFENLLNDLRLAPVIQLGVSYAF